MSSVYRTGRTGGARGVRAVVTSCFFGEEGSQFSIRFCFFAWLLSFLHPLIIKRLCIFHLDWSPIWTEIDWYHSQIERILWFLYLPKSLWTDKGITRNFNPWISKCKLLWKKCLQWFLVFFLKLAGCKTHFLKIDGCQAPVVSFLTMPLTEFSHGTMY